MTAVGMTAVGVAVAGLLCAARVSAHPLAAEPPVFTEPSCILTLDKAESQSHHFPYVVAFDDTELAAGDIELPDAKTHQFFAARGYVARSAGDVVMADAQDAAGTLTRLPHWMSQAEIGRVAAATSVGNASEFSADLVESFDVLEGNAIVQPLLLPITTAEERVPITAKQAAAGVTWDFSEVPLGAYQIVGYIFSPPYNGWAERPGMVRVVMNGQGPPALTVDRVAAQVFAGQGRRIRGCVAASAGSTLQVAARPANDLEAPFEPWGEAVTVDGEAFETCLPSTGEDAVLEVRFELHDPAGHTLYHRPLETLTLFSRAAPCMESDMYCCPDSTAGDSAAERADAMGDMDAGVASTAPGGGRLPATWSESAQSGGGVAAAEAKADTGSGGGCSVQAGNDRRLDGYIAFVGVLAIWSLRRARRPLSR